MKKQLQAKLQKISDGVLNIAGIFSTPRQGAQPAGVSKLGADVFTATNLASAVTLDAGAALIHGLGAFVYPFKVLDKRSIDEMTKLADLSRNRSFITALDREHEKRKGENFATTLIKAIGVPTDHALAVLTSVKLYDHWGVMSPAQKTLAIAAMGIQLHKTNKNGAICDLVIVEGPGQKFTVKDALDLVQAGKNPYGLVLGWEQIYRLLRVYNDNPSNEAMSDFAITHNLLGNGPNDAAVAGVSRKLIDQNGAKPAPQYGVGALAVPSGKELPSGYTSAMQSPNGDIIVPEANAKTARGAMEGSLLGTKAGVDGISSDAVATYKKWKPADSTSKDRGVEGGSALIAGFTQLKSVNPYLYSAMLAFLMRYSHSSVDTDNSSKYVAALAGIALARIVAGKAEAQADKEGAALALSVQANDPADYAKLQINMRAMYANFGVSSKADAYQLSNQAYSENRIDETDLVCMHEVYDLVYDQNSFGAIPKLIQAKDKGLRIAKENLHVKNTMVDGSLGTRGVPVFMDIREKNRAKYQAQQQPQPEVEEENSESEVESETPGEEMTEAGASGVV